MFDEAHRGFQSRGRLRFTTFFEAQKAQLTKSPLSYAGPARDGFEIGIHSDEYRAVGFRNSGHKHVRRISSSFMAKSNRLESRSFPDLAYRFRDIVIREKSHIANGDSHAALGSLYLRAASISSVVRSGYSSIICFIPKPSS